MVKGFYKIITKGLKSRKHEIRHTRWRIERP